MTYIIVQDSRLNIGMNIALVDKNKTTIQGRWWTSLLEHAKQFESKEKANIICSKYRFNNPRVVPYDEAKNVIIPIVTYTYGFNKTKQRKNIFEMDIYEYKSWLGYSDANECGGGIFD